MQFRAISLSFAIMGLFLMSIALFYSLKEVTNIGKNEFHKLVTFSGQVTRERISGTQHYMYVGNISVRCSCENKHLDGKDVKIIGFVEEYEGKFYSRALRIFIGPGS